MLDLLDFANTTFEQDAKKFQEVTGVKLYRDGLMTAILGKSVIDIFKVDEALMRKYSYEGKSLREFVTQKFGASIMYILDKNTLTL